MANDRGGIPVRHVRTLYTLGAVGQLSDGHLLERFATRDGEAAELAFAVLVERHGPMVLRVCRSVLRDGHDAQDAFQATFLVLVICDLEGQTHEQAARHLGWPVGTVKSRLARGRERLRERLGRRGLALSASLLGSLLAAKSASAAVSAAAGEAAEQARMCFALGRAATVGRVPVCVVVLAEKVTRSLLMSRLKSTAATLLVITATAAGASALLRASEGHDDGPAKAALTARDRPENTLRANLRATVRAVVANPVEDLVNGQFFGGIETLCVLAKAQAKFGDRDAARETLRQAVELADDALESTAMSANRRPELLAKVAWVQAKLGETQAARETVRKAIEVAKVQRRKSDALKTIVAVQTVLSDFDGAMATLRSLRDATRSGDDSPGGLCEAWSNLIRATAWTGDYDGASALAVEAGRKLNDLGIREDGLRDVAVIACTRSDFGRSLRAAGALTDLQTKQAVLRQIASFQAHEGDVQGAKDWIRRLDSPHLRASAMDGLALGLAVRVDGGREVQGMLEP